jgi:putative ABC transport system permease protein
VLRALGASRRVVFGVLAVEAGVIAGIGALAGIALGRAIAAFIGWWVARESGLQLVPMPIGLSDLATALAAVSLGLAAGAIPAYLACRQDVARNLAPLT